MMTVNKIGARVFPFDLNNLCVVASNFDCFIVLLRSVVIGQVTICSD